MKNSGRILLHVTGSIAAYKAAILASKLVQRGYSVKTVLSRGALDFIGKGTFEGLTGERVWTDLFDDGTRMDHIHLARWSDLQLIYPATAETIAKLRAGRADDLTGALHLARERAKPFWIAPAMNPEMMASPAVRENLAKLVEWEIDVVDADVGRTACGEYGLGRLIEPEAMLLRIDAHFANAVRGSVVPTATATDTDTDAGTGTDADLTGVKILVTAGGTYEPLDPVRGLTNVSTGETGTRVAEGLARAGADVTLLLARTALPTPASDKYLRVERFQTFDELESLMKAELTTNAYDVCVHGAAVSDFRVDRVEAGDTEGNRIEVSSRAGEKIASGANLTISLVPRKKLVSEVKTVSKNPAIRLISFKLVSGSKGATAPAGGSSEAAATAALAAVAGYPDSDAVVYNVATDVERGTERHRAKIYSQTRARSGAEIKSSNAAARWVLSEEVATKTAIVSGLIRLIQAWRSE